MSKPKTVAAPIDEYLDLDGAPTPKGQRTRARILASARRNLEECGYFEATVTEITAGSDVALGTFYRYFTNKEEAFMVVLEHLVLELHQAAGGDLGRRRSVGQSRGSDPSLPQRLSRQRKADQRARPDVGRGSGVRSEVG